MARIGLLKISVLTLALVWLGGCVQTKTVPGYARAGDHIVIGLGGINRNAGGETALKKEDLTITLRDVNGQPYNLEARFIFKSYPDHVSTLNALTLNGENSSFGLNGMVPFDGGWFVVAPLTEFQQYNTPLSLPPGDASISVASAKLLNTADLPEGDHTTIPIEIIAGTSAQDSQYIQQFFGYVAYDDNFVISPSDLSGIDEVGGGFFVIDYNDDTFFEAGLEPMVVPSEHNPYVQLGYNVVSNGDNTGSIYVTLLNPAGFKSLATSAPNSSQLADLSVKLIYFSDGSSAEAKSNFSVNATDSYYIGMNGDVIPGVAPTLTHAEDL